MEALAVYRRPGASGGTDGMGRVFWDTPGGPRRQVRERPTPAPTSDTGQGDRRDMGRAFWDTLTERREREIGRYGNAAVAS